MPTPPAIEIKKFFGRLLAFVIISASIIASTVLIANFPPPDRLYPVNAFDWSYIPPEHDNTTFNVLFDQHSHTFYSDGVLSPEENIQWHLAHGFNAMALTDHDRIDGALEAQRIAREKYNDTIKVLVGMEWTTSRIHMNLLGISSWIFVPAIGTDTEIQAAIASTHAQGGIVVVNHIPWSLRVGMDHPNRSQLRGWGVDYIEIVNENDYDNDSIDFFHGTGVGNITGTDMHSPGTVHGWTQLSVPAFTEEAIFAALKARNTSIIYNNTGSPDHSLQPYENPAYTALEPIIIIGDTFENIYDEGVLAIVLAFLYLFAAFMVGEWLRVLKRRYWQRANAKNENTRAPAG